jgi:hypothetical protein
LCICDVILSGFSLEGGFFGAEGWG